MELTAFTDMQTEFMERIQQAVYCNMATVDRQERPRSRIIHPIWELAEFNPVGWVISWPQTHKAKHLARNPYVSLAYVANKERPVYIDCKAEWVDDETEQWRIWELHKMTPPPVGFDPEPHFGNINHLHFGLLKFTPWRIELGNLYGEPLIWRPSAVISS